MRSDALKSEAFSTFNFQLSTFNSSLPAYQIYRQHKIPPVVAGAAKFVIIQ